MSPVKIAVFVICFFVSVLAAAASVQQDQEGISRQMGVTITDLLWRYDPVLIEKTLKSSVQNYRLQGVLLYDAGLKEYHAAWPHNGEVVYRRNDTVISVPAVEAVNPIRQTLYHQGNQLGELLLYPELAKPSVQLSEQEKTYLITHPVIRVSNELEYPPYDFAINGQPQGYNIDLIRLLAEKVGIDVEFINGYPWRELLNLFKQGEIDLLHAVRKNSERQQYGIFSKPYRRLKTYFITLSTTPDVTDIEQLYGKTFAVGKGWYQEEYLRKHHPEVKLLVVDNTVDMLEAVSTGRAYATANNGDVANYLITKQDLRDLKVSGWFEEMDQGEVYTHHFMASKKAPELISIINKALASLTLEDLENLERKWFSEPSQTSAVVARNKLLGLTPTENRYLNQRPLLTYCIDPEWMPFERLGENNKHEGLTADLFRQIESRILVNLVFVPTESWDQSLEYTRKGRCKLLTAAANTPQRIDYLDFSKPHFEPSLVMVVRSEEVFVEDFATVRDREIGVVKNYAHKELIRKRYPEQRIVEVKSVTDGLRLVHEGALYGFVDTVPTINYQMRRGQITDLKIGAQLNIGLSLSIALHKEEPPQLLSIMNKALDSFSAEEYKLLADKWFAIKIEKVTDYALLWQILAAVAVLLFGFLYWNRKLRLLNQNISRKESLFRTTIESVNSGILVVDHRGAMTHFNDRFREMWRIPQDLAKSLNNATFLGYVKSQVKDPGQFIEKVDALSQSSAITTDLVNFNDGRIFHQFSQPLERKDLPAGRIWSFEDITDETNRQSELELAKEQAEIANRIKSEFIANMSHEIRTPLNAIIGFTELLERTEITPKQKEYLQAVKMGGRNLLKLIGDVLDLSKIEAGRFCLEEDTVNIRCMLQEIEHIFAFKVQDKSLSLRLLISDDMPALLILDEVRLRQVLLNLVGNAIKFTHTGGIELEAGISDSNESANVELKIAVRDTGIGIPEDQHENIFGSFVQQPGQDNRVYGGTGLGLAISKKLIELMHGRIRLSSAPGKGSCFTIYLPNIRIPETQEAVLPEADEKIFSVKFEPLPVIVADDVNSNRKLLTSTLEAQGLIVVEACDGVQAVNLCEEFEPALIIMDIRMPNMNGIEATQRIRANPAFTNLPVIALTASVQSQEPFDMFQSWLEKPVSLHELIVTLKKYLPYQLSTANSNDLEAIAINKLLDRKTLQSNLNEHLNSLFQQARESGFFDDAIAFADALKSLGTETKTESLLNFGDQLMSAAQRFDVPTLHRLLMTFEQLLADEEVVNEPADKNHINC